MAAIQKNNRIENTAGRLNVVASDFVSIRKSMQKFLDTIRRDSSLIKNILNDSELSDDDFVHNKLASPTVGEYRRGIKAAISLAYHLDWLTQEEGNEIFSDLGISDDSFISLNKLENNLDKILA